jgi:hypothetical protein
MQSIAFYRTEVAFAFRSKKLAGANASLIVCARLLPIGDGDQATIVGIVSRRCGPGLDTELLLVLMAFDLRGPTRFNPLADVQRQV